MKQSALSAMSPAERSKKFRPPTPPPLPVHFGDLTGPMGNTYHLISNVKRSVTQFQEAGFPVRQEIKTLLNPSDKTRLWSNLQYAEIVAILREHCDDLDGSWEALEQHMEDIRYEDESNG